MIRKYYQTYPPCLPNGERGTDRGRLSNHTTVSVSQHAAPTPTLPGFQWVGGWTCNNLRSLRQYSDCYYYYYYYSDYSNHSVYYASCYSNNSNGSKDSDY